nr:unnamed protein product [Callosobruchus analis]
MYIEVMRECERLRHMTQINTKNESNAQVFYLPHHGVYREGSSTTKLRLVLDESAQSDTGLSLNDALRVSPIVQRELSSILFSFHKHNVILVNDKDRKFQQIVYREDKHAELKLHSLHQAADNYVDRYPRTSRAIKGDFYMDDFISGRK